MIKIPEISEDTNSKHFTVFKKLENKVSFDKNNYKNFINKVCYNLIMNTQ